jgi:hypothetical protein
VLSGQSAGVHENLNARAEPPGQHEEPPAEPSPSPPPEPQTSALEAEVPPASAEDAAGDSPPA